MTIKLLMVTRSTSSGCGHRLAHGDVTAHYLLYDVGFMIDLLQTHLGNNECYLCLFAI